MTQLSWPGWLRRGSAGGGAGIPGPLMGAVCGLVTAAAAIGVAQLFSGLFIAQSSPVIDVGQATIGLTPGRVKEWATSTFGHNDKNVLITGVLVILFVYAGAVGVVAVRRLWLGMAGIGVFAAIGLTATLTRPNATVSWVVPTLVGAAAGAFVMYRLVMAAHAIALASAEAAPKPPIVFGGAAGGKTSGGGKTGGSGGKAGGSSKADRGSDELRAPDLPAKGARGSVPAGGRAPGKSSGTPGGRPPALPDKTGEVRAPRLPGTSVPSMRWPAPRQSAAPRRAFIATAGVALAGAGAGALIGRQLTIRHNVSAARSAVRLPRAAVPAPVLPPGVNLPVPGISPFITSNDQFYRIDTALIIPQVDPSNWQLRIHGMVAREIVITFDELLRRPLIEDYVTLCCVSNPVGGPLISNAKFLGASYAALVREAGPQRGADQLLVTSVDGFTLGTPISVVLDGRDAMIAVAMNGSALPVAHGFPARLVVPGLYGYVSACKWVTDIEVTTFAKAAGYWVQNGWSQQAPIKTESRIDVPSGGATVNAGRVPVAGVAWAQHKGIEAVEVRVDGGQWHEATLAAVPDIDCWRQWVWYWDATPGRHTIEARATDKTGYTQTAVNEPVAPNGATGYPSNQVQVNA